MTMDDLLADGAPPIAAILRGIRPDEALDVAAALVEAGIRILEVPFNSPDPLVSIGAMQQAFGDRAIIGGGTVLSVVTGGVVSFKNAENAAGILSRPCPYCVS